MERAVWLRHMRQKTEALYNYISPRYWEKYGMWVSETHVRYLVKFLSRLAPGSRLLSGGCGAGLYEGILLEGGHRVVGFDLSAEMLARARARHPSVTYEKKGLQEMDYQNEFDGAICIDALEHVFPEDWPAIVHGFWQALKPGGVLYLTVDVSATDFLQESYERAQAQGLPVVFGEVAADVAQAFEKVMAMGMDEDPGELEDQAVYHFYPSVEQVRQWLEQENFVIEAEEMGVKWYRHFLDRKR